VVGVLYGALPYGVIQFTFSAQATRLSTPTIVGIYSTLAPMFATATGMIAFGDTVSLWIMIGAVLIIFGVLFVIAARYWETRKQKVEPKPTTESANVDVELEIVSVKILK